jgi:hypothetical protein
MKLSPSLACCLYGVKRTINSHAAVLVALLFSGLYFSSCKPAPTEEPTAVPPVIESFTPTFGGAATEVIIRGKNFGAEQGSNLVWLGLQAVEVIRESQEEIVVQVPEFVSSGNLTVKAHGQVAVTTDKFIFIQPSITSFSPIKGQPGTQVKIQGMNLIYPAITNTLEPVVKFNGVQASIISVTENTLDVIVPENSSSGKITLEIANVIVTSVQDFLVPPWQKLSDFPGTAKIGSMFFAIGNKGYVVSGGPYTSGVQNDTWEFDGSNETWTQKADFPGEGRFLGIGFTLFGKGYVGAGETDNSIFKNDFWEYDPAADSWTQKANIPVISTNEVAFALDGFGYVGTKGEFWQYDPSLDVWTEKNNFPADDWGSVSFTINGYGYAIVSSSAEFWQYNPTSDVWVQKADFPGGNRHSCLRFSLGSKGYVASGSRPGGESAPPDCWVYDADSDTWNQMPEGFIDYRNWAVATNETAYVGLGTRYAPGEVAKSMKDWWRFKPLN